MWSDKKISSTKLIAHFYFHPNRLVQIQFWFNQIIYNAIFIHVRGINLTPTAKTILGFLCPIFPNVYFLSNVEARNWTLVILNWVCDIMP